MRVSTSENTELKNKSIPTYTSLDAIALQADLTLFRTQATAICEFLAKNKIAARPFDSEDLPLFRSLTPAKRSEILASLNSWTEVLTAFPEFDVAATELQVLWRTLQRAGYRFAPDLFEHLTKDTVIEVYTRDNRQIFRSLQFFSVCSYTLEHVYSLAWFQLYARDSSIELESIELFNRLCRRELTGLVFKPFANHEVRECLPGHSRTTSIEPLLIAPLTNSSGELSGFLNAFTVKKMHQKNSL